MLTMLLARSVGSASLQTKAASASASTLRLRAACGARLPQLSSSVSLQQQEQLRPYGTPASEQKAAEKNSSSQEEGLPTDYRKHWREAPSWEKRYGGGRHAFPDWIEHLDRKMFYKIGFGLTALTATAGVGLGATSFAVVGLPTALFWFIGLRDINQTQHTIRRNFPVFGNIRYLFETIRPEIRQYFIESDDLQNPFSREQRSMVYQRSKLMTDTVPFGTRKQVYKPGFEWIHHSMYPTKVDYQKVRVKIGNKDCLKPYSAARLNVSAMSFGAISANAILALNRAALEGQFYHNTGEGSISRYHKQHGGDLVWNLGTAYFGARDKDGNFSPELFRSTIQATPSVRMIEIKLSQGAKPGSGGILPRQKITPDIAEARGVGFDRDVISPSTHTAFTGPRGLILFVRRLRELSGGLPVGFKLCVGRPEEFASVVKAMIEMDHYPDFITIDGSEGGTGAAPLEFTDSVGMPLVEGLTLVHNLLIGCNIRQHITLIASGKIISGFDLVKTIALGADVCNSARGMMFSLGCIQALKCGSNRCPTGIATQDEELQKGLVVEEKWKRVCNFQASTLRNAFKLIGAVGLSDPVDLEPEHIIRRVSEHRVMSYEAMFAKTTPGELLEPGNTSPFLREALAAAKSYGELHC